MYAKIDHSEFNELKAILEENSNEKLEMRDNMGRLWIEGDVSELMLRLNTHLKQIVIARIFIKNKRKGTGTKTLNWLKDYAKQNNYDTIIIESTTTQEINNFVKKHGFKPLEYTGVVLDGEFYGNWGYNVS